MRTEKLLVLGVISTIGVGALACESVTDNNGTVDYSANLSAASEIPAPTGSPTATGTATLSLTAGKVLTVSVTVVGNLTSGVNGAHVHGPAATSATAGIILDFVPSMTTVINAGTRTGTVVSTSFDLNTLVVGSTSVLRVSADSLIAFMNTGRAYVNVHTTTNPAGEIRGQVVK